VITPSLLPIYHVANDRYTDELGVEQVIAGSQGLTFNANMFIGYKIAEHNAIQLSVGFPLIVRNARPDGLTRSVIASIEYQVGF
jgi:hypothetical protein